MNQTELFSPKLLISSSLLILSNPKFSHYLAGMLEGNISIKIPDNLNKRKLAPFITIVFVDGNKRIIPSSKIDPYIKCYFK